MKKATVTNGAGGILIYVIEALDEVEDSPESLDLFKDIPELKT
jgi:hypothetical protein